MRTPFRQGIVSHQTGTFLSINGSGHVDLLATNKPVTVNLAHKTTNYIHSEDNTVTNAWIGPFIGTTNYWLYVDFNPLTFSRTFGTTTVEPVAQSTEPGSGDAAIDSVVAGDPGVGSFVVLEHYILEVGRNFNVTGSTGNDGTYTVASATFDGGIGKTTITVDEIISDATVDGSLTLDVDSFGTALLINGRHWYNTSTDIHYVRNGGAWSEVLRIFVSQLISGTFLSQSIAAPLFTNTQIGNGTSVLSGRVLFDESLEPQLRDDGTFLTTEDQFFTNQSRTDGIRLESNVSKAQSDATTLAAFTVVAYVSDGKITTAEYSDTGSTVIGLLTESVAINEVGSVVLQGVVTNPDWNWLSSTTIGAEMWADNGLLVTTDPHTTDPITYPQGNVPVARVLSNDTIIFEQGLGGKGDKGATGSVASLPPATTVDIGGVTLVTASSDAGQAFVISDTDSRLADPRNPLPHTHTAIDITYVPGTGMSALDIQDAIDELAVEKLNLTGGILTGALVLAADPTNPLEAATQQYVDAVPTGLANIVDDTTPQLGGDLDINSNDIIALGATDITITPDTGAIVLDGLRWPTADGTADYVLQTDGIGNLSWAIQSGGGGADYVAINSDGTLPVSGGVNSIVIGEGASAAAGAVNSIAIGTLTTTGAFDSCVVVGHGSAASALNQTIIGPALTSGDVSSDVSYSLKMGCGTVGQLNFIHLHTRGHLEIVGNEAQYIIPTYITGSIPATTVVGGVIYDTTTSQLKINNGSVWSPVGKAEPTTTYGTTGAIALDTSTGTYFTPTGTTTGIITFSFTNPAVSGNVTAFTLQLQGAGDFAPVWPAGVEWPGGTEPTWTAGGKDVVGFISTDGGTTWLGMLGGLAFA